MHSLKQYLKELRKASLDVEKFLEPTSALSVLRNRFLIQSRKDPSLRWPNFQYERCDAQVLEPYGSALRKLRLLPELAYAQERELWQWLLEDAWAKYHLLSAVAKYQTQTCEAEQTWQQSVIQLRSRQLYGAPSKELFYQALQAQLDWIGGRELDADDREFWLETLSEFALAWPPYLPGIYQPRLETMQQFGELLHERLLPDCSNASRGPTIICPASGRGLDVRRLRSLPYESGHLPELSQGLPGGDEFEEGLVLCVEQVMSSQYQTQGWWRALSYYVDIGLAEFHHYDFRDILELRQKLDFLAGCWRDEPRAERRMRYERAYEHAFTEVLRCFWGANELVPTKNIRYLQGNIRVWQYIERNLKWPDRLYRNLFQHGRTDPENPMHQRFVKFDLRHS